MGYGFKYSLKPLAIRGDYTKTLDEAIQVQIRQATRAWLRAVQACVPQWTGQAAGAIVLANGDQGPLAEYLRVAQNLNPEHETKSRNPDTGSEKGSYTFTHLGHRYTFNYHNRLIYFYYNDTQPRTDIPGSQNQQIDAPWFALIAGREAFQAYMREFGIPRLPKIQDFIVVSEIKG